MTAARDVHSYSNPGQVRVRHLDLDLEVLFESRVLRGSVTLAIDGAGELVLDTRDLAIERVEASNHSNDWAPARFELGTRDKILGAALKIALPPGAKQVRVRYATSPDASGLQWLTPAQTAGKEQPFLFTQSQAIHARSWIPLQDTPGVRVTYSARIRTPPHLRAVMSAVNDPSAPRDGEYTFRMPHAIPSYLMALAAGDIEFRALSARTGVWAEGPIASRAARELEDTEKMMQAAEALYGPYRWDRYDLLVLPPSFPFGGMENPCLTFLTPTILAGDKSLVALVAHELAHSWSGNLVTNATWSDFWLNEGFTTYIERRIQERVFGPRRAEMEMALEVTELRKELQTLPPGDQVLQIDLTGRDPDDGATQVPYVKGALLLRTLEQAYGRERFDRFLRSYFDHFAFRSITTGEFREQLLKTFPDAGRILDEWVARAGLPASAPQPVSEAFDRVAAQARNWLDGKPIATGDWSTQEWLHFLNSLPAELGAEKMDALDRAFGFTKRGNYEVLNAWLVLAVRNRYRGADRRLEEFLLTVGRRKFLKPLYEELAKSEDGKQRARTIFARARSAYHPISAAAVEQILK